MNERREQLSNEIAEINDSISTKEAEIANLQIHNEASKTKAEKVLNDKEIERLRDEILSLERQKAETEAEMSKLKRFKRDYCIANIDLLLAASDKKLGALEKESGNTPGYLSRIKSGKNASDPSIEFLMTIAEELDVPLEMLVSTKLSEMSGTEKYILEFLRKVYEDTEQDKLTWVRESVAELEKIEVQFDGNGEPYVNHPLYTYEEGNLPDGTYKAISRYNSLFFKDCGVKPCGNCYHAKLVPTDQELYLMDCEKGDDRLVWKGDRFFEIYIVTYDRWNSTARKVCNVLEVSAPIVSMINTLVKAIIMSMTHVHIESDVKDAIELYMQGITPTPSDDLPFN